MTTRRPPRAFDDFVALAIEMSKGSPCEKSKRGAVAFRGRENELRELVAVGWNYLPGGESCDGSEACRASCRMTCVHAEQALILVNMANLETSEVIHVKTIDGELVASGGPSCAQCSKLLLAAGVVAVWLYHVDGWRRYEIAEFHRLSIAAGR